MGIATEHYPALQTGYTGLSESTIAERTDRLAATYQLWVATDAVPTPDVDEVFNQYPKDSGAILYCELGEGTKSVVYRSGLYAQRVPKADPDIWVPRYVRNLVPVMGETGFEQIVAFSNDSTYSGIIPAEICAGSVYSRAVNRLTKEHFATFTDTVATSDRLNVRFDTDGLNLQVHHRYPITVLDPESGYQPIVDKVSALARILGDCCMAAETGPARVDLLDWMNPAQWSKPSPTPRVSNEFKGRIEAMESVTSVVVERAAHDQAWAESAVAMRTLTNVVRYKASSYKLAA
jgi:hypothetical protein